MNLTRNGVTLEIPDATIIDLALRRLQGEPQLMAGVLFAPPAIGTVWPEEGGIYAGMVRGGDAESDWMGLVQVHGEDYIITDIGMRMLVRRELFNAQGFPDNYVIDQDAEGEPFTQTASVKMCGNSVSPPAAEAVTREQFIDRVIEVRA